MKLRVILKHLTSSSCLGCSARQQHLLLRRALWVAARRNNVSASTKADSSTKRYQSTDAVGTILQSTKPHVDFPNVSLSDFMFSRFAKFGNKKALVSIRYSEIQYYIRAGVQQNVQVSMCAHRRLRSACASAQSDLNL